MRKIGPKFVSSHVRTICNHWCTRRRFGIDKGRCVFGCGFGDDCISHSLTCPSFCTIASKSVRFDSKYISLVPLLLFHTNDGVVEPFIQAKILIYVHVCFMAHNMCRHGKTMGFNMVRFLLKHLVLRKPGIRKYIASYCYSCQTSGRSLPTLLLGGFARVPQASWA